MVRWFGIFGGWLFASIVGPRGLSCVGDWERHVVEFHHSKVSVKRTNLTPNPFPYGKGNNRVGRGLGTFPPAPFPFEGRGTEKNADFGSGILHFVLE